MEKKKVGLMGLLQARRSNCFSTCSSHSEFNLLCVRNPAGNSFRVTVKKSAILKVGLLACFNKRFFFFLGGRAGTKNLV